MFIRTNNGLANEHLFYNVDLIVYCEGEEIPGEASSLDEVFWHRVFSQNGRNVHCKSMGGKSVLRPLADKVVSEGIPNIIVAMDRDYDDIRGLIVDHPQVIYTFGYSWENDVVLDFEIDHALALFVTVAPRNPMKNEFIAFRNKQSHCLRRAYAIDYKYIGSAGKLFDRQKPLSIIATPGSAEPYLKVKALLNEAIQLGSYQTGQMSSAVYNAACGVRSFFGKAIARIVFHWFAYRTKRINGSRKAQYDSFMNLLANSLVV